jgi:heme/copper-type cytochrome/quinol oxidase subunit 2
MNGKKLPWLSRGRKTGSGWSEETNRAILALVIIAVLVGTPILSMTALAVHGGNETIVVEAGSYHAIHYGFYGFGKLEYSISMSSGPQIYLLDLDRRNFERFAAGKSYDYSGYETIGVGGSGTSMQGGLIWEIYLVFVNDESGTATIEFSSDATCYFSMLAAAAVLGASAAVAYAAYMLSNQKKVDSIDVPWASTSRSVRKTNLLVIVGLVIMPIVIMVALGFVIPYGQGSGPGTAFVRLWGTAFVRFWISILLTCVIAFMLRFKLSEVGGKPEQALFNLAYRLRVSGYRVTAKPGRLSVQISGTIAIKVRAKQTPIGSVVSYQADATPAGWMIWVVLFFFSSYASPVLLAVSLFMLYRASIFATERILPRLSAPPISEQPDTQVDTRWILIDSLSEGRRLSAEAYEAARSNYQDAIILLVSAGLIIATFMALLTYAYLFRDLSTQDQTLLVMLSSLPFALIFPLLSWRLLRARTEPRLKELKSWTTRLDAALSREVAGQSPPDNEPSAFELVVESAREVPAWLKARRRGGMFREPGEWLLIFFLSYWAVMLGFAGVVELMGGDSSIAWVTMSSSAILIVVAVSIYIVWRKQRDKEAKGTLTEWAGRYEAVKAKMETFLRGV